jgi:ABC-type glycerol-3-phosphate transport system substrate-binding protein
MKSKIFALFLIFSFIITSGFGCKSPSAEVKKASEPITLTYWRAYDDADAFAEIFSAYEALHPNVNIEYKKFRYEEYEKELIDALAEDRGPDIFSIPSTWINEYKTKITPLPEKTSMVYITTKGTIKKETVQELRETKSLTIKELKNNYADIISSDVVLNEDDSQKIYGLPLYIDTLAMFYNRDLLNSAGIAEVPQYWNKTFQDAIKNLTKQNSKGNITQAGISMGWGENIERSGDVLALLMMQNGAIMTENNTVMFHSIPQGSDKNYNPGLEALRFYTDFSNPAKDVYCWNGDMENSLEMFEQGNLAITFGYSYHLPIIKAAAPKLNFSVAKMPQIEFSRQINYANYWVETVSTKSKNIDAAWDFIQFETSAENVMSYLKATNKPTALKSLINEQIDDENIGPFVEQILTAKSWYHGKDSRAAETAFMEMINLAAKKEKDLNDIISAAASKVQQTIQK